MPKLLRTILLSAGIAAIIGGSGWLLWGSPYVRFVHLEVAGSVRADLAQVRHLADLPVGEPLLSLDLDRAVAGVERHPWVARARAYRSFPDRVVITIEERTVVAVVQLEELYLVDAEGEIFTRASSGDLDHPYLTGFEPDLVQAQPELARRLVREALTWLVALEQQGKIAERDISELHFSASTGYTVVLRNGSEVLLGFADRERASRLATLAAQGLDLSRPHRVDLVGERLAVVTPL